MQEPTIEDIANEARLYREHLDQGGQPLSIHLYLIPKMGSWDWEIETRFPTKLEHLKWAVMFTKHIKDVIIAAIQPPPEQPTTTQGNN